jgi:hypothetical protein
MILNNTKTILEIQEWPFQSLDETTLKIDIDGKVANWVVLIKVLEEIGQLLIYSISSNKAPQPQRNAVQEFLTRANFGLRIGNFEFNIDTGEIRFKTSLQFAGETLAPEMIEQCLLINMFTMEKYLPGILQMIFTDSSAATVLASIEDHASTPSPESL